jgi:hypothetical protein
MCGLSGRAATASLFEKCVPRAAASVPISDCLNRGVHPIFFGGTKADPAAAAVDLKTLHPKIGSLALESDFLEGVLTKARLLSVKR